MRVICFFALILGLLVMPAYAQTSTTDTIRVAPDKPEILRLDQEASSVVVGSPKYASVTLDSPTTLLIMPRSEGATSLTILNKRGDIIMERRLIIGGPQDNYVRIRRACTATMGGCVPQQTYYCPDGCSEISLGEDIKPIPVSQPQTATITMPMTTPPPIPAIDAADLEEPEQPLDMPQ